MCTVLACGPHWVGEIVLLFLDCFLLDSQLFWLILLSSYTKRVPGFVSISGTNKWEMVFLIFRVHNTFRRFSPCIFNFTGILLKYKGCFIFLCTLFYRGGNGVLSEFKQLAQKLKKKHKKITGVVFFLEHSIPTAPMRHMRKRRPMQKKTSVFMRRSILLRLYRGPLLFSKAFVSWPLRENEIISPLVPICPLAWVIAPAFLTGAYRKRRLPSVTWPGPSSGRLLRTALEASPNLPACIY